MPFDHARLDAYQLAIESVAKANYVVEQLPRGRGYVEDQLQRAALRFPWRGRRGSKPRPPA
jgi:hypothetical protein